MPACLCCFLAETMKFHKYALQHFSLFFSTEKIKVKNTFIDLTRIKTYETLFKTSKTLCRS